MRQLGLAGCERVFREVASGARTGRLLKLLPQGSIAIQRNDPLGKTSRVGSICREQLAVVAPTQLPIRTSPRIAEVRSSSPGVGVQGAATAQRVGQTRRDSRAVGRRCRHVAGRYRPIGCPFTCGGCDTPRAHRCSLPVCAAAASHLCSSSA